MCSGVLYGAIERNIYLHLQFSIYEAMLRRCVLPVVGRSLDVPAGKRAGIEKIDRKGELVTARIRSRSGDSRIDVVHGDVYLAAGPEEDPAKVSVVQGTA
jgi:hypothetical protein